MGYKGYISYMRSGRMGGLGKFSQMAGQRNAEKPSAAKPEPKTGGN